MDTLAAHYHRMIGLDADWVVADVDLDLAVQKLSLRLEFVSASVTCPECEAS